MSKMLHDHNHGNSVYIKGTIHLSKPVAKI